MPVLRPIPARASGEEEELARPSASRPETFAATDRKAWMKSFLAAQPGPPPGSPFFGTPLDWRLGREYPVSNAELLTLVQMIPALSPRNRDVVLSRSTYQTTAEHSHVMAALVKHALMDGAWGVKTELAILNALRHFGNPHLEGATDESPARQEQRRELAYAEATTILRMARRGGVLVSWTAWSGVSRTVKAAKNASQSRDPEVRAVLDRASDELCKLIHKHVQARRPGWGEARAIVVLLELVGGDFAASLINAIEVGLDEPAKRPKWQAAFAHKALEVVWRRVSPEQMWRFAALLRRLAGKYASESTVLAERVRGLCAGMKDLPPTGMRWWIPPGGVPHRFVAPSPVLMEALELWVPTKENERGRR